MHLYVEASRLKAIAPWGYEKHSHGFLRTTLVDHTVGSVHQGTGICELQPRGWVDACVHANEEGIYVFEGELEMRRGREAFHLSKDDYALVPYGVPHAYRNRGNNVVRWFEVLAPQPKPPGEWQDTFFIPDAGWPEEIIRPDFEDPRIKLLGHFTEGGRFAGIRLRGLTTYHFMNRNFGGQLFLLMRGELAPGGTLGPHDHPVEECYYGLSGELEFEMEGKIYHLKPGDLTWTGVGARHTWRNKGSVPYRWIETHVPEFPEQFGVRDLVHWDRLRNL